MELSIRDVALALGESEETIYRWAHDGTLPAHRVHEQYGFNKVELQEWATSRGRKLPPSVFGGPGGEELPSLRTAIVRGGVFHGVPGSRREEVLAAVCELPGIPEGIDRALLKELLVGREKMASTGIGRGIAIPHTRDPLVVFVDEPTVVVAFLAERVDFGAVDGEPVRVLFVILSPTVALHLKTLSRLAFVLHDPTLGDLLRRAAPPDEILERIGELERSGGRG